MAPHADLTQLLSELPLWLGGLVCIGVPTLLAACGPLLVRRLVAFEQIKSNNEVAGFKFATVGVVYAVLLGFSVIVVWERFADAEQSATQEAASVAAMYRLAPGFGSPTSEKLHDELTRYATTVVEEDWPDMASGHGSAASQSALSEIYTAIVAFGPVDGRASALMAEFFQQLDNVTQARRERLVLAGGIIPNVLWLVLVTGACITIGFTFFFGTENLRAQILMTSLLALLISMTLFTAVSIDHPFSGAVEVSPDAMELVLRDFAGKP